jgi:type I restriction enzyme S subunit
MMDERLLELPKGWVRSKLGEISEVILGQSPPSSTYNEDGKGLPFYQGKLEFGEIYPTPQKWCSAPKKIAEKGDVLISVRAPVGPTNMCSEKSCIGRGLAALRVMAGIEPFFILYLMRAFEKNVAEQGTGTTFNAITGGQLNSFVIPLPPIPEQHRIVAKIEELFTKLDAGIEALKKIKAKLKRYRQAVLKYAFEGKLTQEWREGNKGKIGPASAILERIKEEQKKETKGKFKELPPVDTSELPQLPDGWVWSRVGDISRTIHYGYTASAEANQVGPRILRITDIQDNSVDWGSVPYCKIDDSEKGKYLLKEGDLVFARTGATVGKSFLIRGKIPETVFASYLIRIILEKNIDRAYVYDFFQSNHYWSQIHEGKLGIGQPNVNAQVLSQIYIPLPSFHEQNKIVEEIENRLSVAEEIEKVAEQSLKQSERLRQSMLKRAFEGKLVPQDPTDEPASMLLERIRLNRQSKDGKLKIRAHRGSEWVKTS